jgi:hypothetical protein
VHHFGLAGKALSPGIGRGWITLRGGEMIAELSTGITCRHLA